VTKSIHRAEYAPILAGLVALRHEAGMTQAELAARLERTQAWVSAVELGDRRMDLLQVYDWCVACGVSLTKLAMRVDKAVAAERVKSGADKKVAPRKKAKRRTGRRLPRRSG
jgi:transcriptional regulator with XRE-family HTH domain